MHSSLLVSYLGREVMLDCGADWVRRVHRMRPDAIVLTHAHPDHASGLRSGAPCKVYATEQTWRIIEHFPVAERAVVLPRVSFRVNDIAMEAFPVAHSIRAPAVGYRITAGRTSVFYAPDLVCIGEPHEALHGIRIYVGDGATLVRPLIRKRGASSIGHSSIRTQLTWCHCEGVAEAVFTHCGSEIVKANSRVMNRAVRELGAERGVLARIAFDGFTIVLP